MKTDEHRRNPNYFSFKPTPVLSPCLHTTEVDRREDSKAELEPGGRCSCHKCRGGRDKKAWKPGLEPEANSTVTGNGCEEHG